MFGLPVGGLADFEDDETLELGRENETFALSLLARLGSLRRLLAAALLFRSRFKSSRGIFGESDLSGITSASERDDDLAPVE